MKQTFAAAAVMAIANAAEFGFNIWEEMDVSGHMQRVGGMDDWELDFGHGHSGRGHTGFNSAQRGRANSSRYHNYDANHYHWDHDHGHTHDDHTHEEEPA